MKYYSKCPICGDKPSFSIRKEISLNGNDTIIKTQMEEFLTKISKEQNPEEIVSVCIKCRSAYRQKFFNEEELEAIYNEAYFRMEEKISKVRGFVYNDEEVKSDYSKKIFKLVKEIENQYQIKIMNIYDVGGRDGFMMKDLAQSGYNCTVFDPIPCDSCSAAVLKKNMWISQIERKPAADMVLLCGILEHCLDPTATLQRCSEVLKKKGFLYIEVPYDLGSVLNWIVFSRWSRRNLNIDLTHFIFFSLRSLGYLLKKTGFECIRMSFRRLYKSNIIAINILAQKPEGGNIRKLCNDTSLGFDLLRSGYLARLPEKAFRKILNI